jgi:hypothetical protein
MGAVNVNKRQPCRPDFFELAATGLTGCHQVKPAISANLELHTKAA